MLVDDHIKELHRSGECVLGLQETKGRGAGELGDNIRYGSRGHSAGNVRQRKEAIESWSIRYALVVSQDGLNGKSSRVIVHGNDDLIVRIFFGLLHEVDVGGEDGISLAQLVAGETTPKLGSLDSL